MGPRGGRTHTISIGNEREGAEELGDATPPIATSDRRSVPGWFGGSRCRCEDRGGTGCRRISAPRRRPGSQSWSAR